MWEERFGQAIRLRLLALVLALALTWYAMNPAPTPVRRVKGNGEPPGEKRREAQPPVIASHDLTEAGLTKSSASLFPSDVERNTEELDWPELIDGN